jgi:hypothetical protein
MGERFCVSEIIHSDEIDIIRACSFGGAKYVPANAAESIYCETDCHDAV